MWLATPAWADVALSVASLRHPAFEADGLTIDFASARKGEADIRIERLLLAGIEYRQLQLHCADFVLDARRIDCPKGEIRRADQRGRDRPALPFSFAYGFADGKLAMTIENTDVLAWSPLIKRLRSWKPAGSIDLKLVADRQQAQLDLAVRQLKFANPAGDVAGEAIELKLKATAERIATGWQWQAEVDWPAGELYIAPWYRRAGINIDAQGTLDDQALAVDMARFIVSGIGVATASLNWNRQTGALDAWGMVTEPLDLATAFREGLQPWLDQSAVPTVQASGRLRLAAAWGQGGWQSVYAGLEDTRLIDGTGYLELTGMNAHIPWQRGVQSEAEFSVAAARLGDLPLGGFRIPLRLSDQDARLDGLSIPLLDGRLYIDNLVATAPTAQQPGWQGEFSGGIEGLSMPKISTALKLPIMAGSLTTRIPRARYAQGALVFDGDIVIDVFDGRVVASGLQVLEPLRPTQRFLANVSARNLDFGLLTQTFSVGAIAGRFDADITGLSLNGWRPERFDAYIASSPGDYRRAISRGALQDISSLGGVAGAAAVKSSPAGLFNSFEYRRIGVGCALREDVCHLSGLAPVGEGYLMVEGSGIPSVQVIGYNRRIDWNLLVSRIQAIIAGKSKAVIE